ncbi:BTB/POZ domain-containing protein 3/6 [Pelomyxa schiedti]|nr:BTB/POZ domain-containing protein 3/6 [Pelomyxa schiedti]
MSATSASSGGSGGGTLWEHCGALVGSATLSDVTLTVMGTPINAHKIFLSRSPVLRQLLVGDVKQLDFDDPMISLIGVKSFLLYLYTDKAELSVPNVLPTKYIATKFQLPSLAAHCTAFSHSCLSPLTVCGLLSSAIQYEDRPLIDACCTFLTYNPIETESFADLSQAALQMILGQPHLATPEDELLNGCNQFAQKQMKERKLPPTPESKSEVLKDILPLVTPPHPREAAAAPAPVRWDPARCHRLLTPSPDCRTLACGGRAGWPSCLAKRGCRAGVLQWAVEHDADDPFVGVAPAAHRTSDNVGVHLALHVSDGTIRQKGMTICSFGKRCYGRVIVTLDCVAKVLGFTVEDRTVACSVADLLQQYGELYPAVSLDDPGKSLWLCDA